MSLFSKLRDLIDDDLMGLEALAAGDPPVKKLCLDLGWCAFFLSVEERRKHRLFTAPVDPKFVAAWRDYEARYATAVAGLLLLDLGLSPEEDGSTRTDLFQERWDE